MTGSLPGPRTEINLADALPSLGPQSPAPYPGSRINKPGGPSPH
jgi:hypothetical protein